MADTIRGETNASGQQADVSLNLSFPAGDRGENRHTTLHQVVRPMACFGNCDQEIFAAVGFARHLHYRLASGRIQELLISENQEILAFSMS
jgi:hypothetical protein